MRISVGAKSWLPSITGTSAWLLCAGFVESDTFSKSKADLKTAFDLGDREIDDRCGQFGETRPKQPIRFLA